MTYKTLASLACDLQACKDAKIVKLRTESLHYPSNKGLITSIFSSKEYTNLDFVVVKLRVIVVNAVQPVDQLVSIQENPMRG